MKRIALAIALTLPVGATVTPAFAQPTANLAPADRYFGRLKMSIWASATSSRTSPSGSTPSPSDAEHVYDKAVLVEDALHDWQRHFPRDPSIPSTATRWRSSTARSRPTSPRRRNDTLDWLIATYPQRVRAASARLTAASWSCALSINSRRRASSRVVDGLGFEQIQHQFARRTAEEARNHVVHHVALRFVAFDGRRDR